MNRNVFTANLIAAVIAMTLAGLLGGWMGYLAETAKADKAAKAEISFVELHEKYGYND